MSVKCILFATTLHLNEPQKQLALTVISVLICKYDELSEGLHVQCVGWLQDLVQT